MEKIKHKCIRTDCQNTYEDDDFDAYYCPSCNEERKKIAKEVDRKMANVVSKRPMKSNLQIFNEMQKAKGTRFVNIKDLS